ncbi:hypothetical protein NEUTE1DRAFT_98648 [Neurospora tetrasperma FGSC 2508]|uniref:Uncharacterized protein n=1 Tax=Neurospora tetrasperma (strain FGSC 2508 / ATCC MYA-4615 / P0657) TaxID=510951 RepID=F8ME20_NEUT8|nr:uncharacterized protein NEUTE1DRAFT_98648 [Neurospora tetrasperma FGSC 2508]EGO61555.1 hypothetical protein NEUTE1DRAFT_98648 [Neurospora tetrasperma FGSC 2508]
MFDAFRSGGRKIRKKTKTKKKTRTKKTKRRMKKVRLPLEDTSSSNVPFLPIMKPMMAFPPSRRRRTRRRR